MALAARDLGFELEVNQALAAGPGWRRARLAVADSPRDALGRETQARTPRGA